MKYVVDVAGGLPTYGALADAKPLVTCGVCKWRGKSDRMGFGSCYWDANPARQIYPEDYYCKLGEMKEGKE